ncbi:TPM domain-containing protein [Polymorphobacter sp.]|uniref:TPM domain-containing protein n=1 Tax=Polymorphobacter sp. TaxID=1909290 RepID=UPI003F71F86B
MLFTDADRARISAAISEAESRTSGEIVVIVSTTPHRYASSALTIASLAALALPFTAVLFGWSPADLLPDWETMNWDTMSAEAHERRSLEVLIIIQALLFAGVLALGWFTPLARALTPQGLRRDRVHAAALSQFRARGLEATAGRTGVLLYIDEPDHIAEVIADTGIFARVSPDHWADTVDALIDGIRAGKPADGLVAAIGLAGAVLSQHFPAGTENRNELPDHLIEI